MHVVPYVVSSGRVSPFPLQAPSGGLAAGLVVDAVSSLLIVAVDRPTSADLDVLTTGRIQVALDWERTSAFLCWHFSQATGPSLVLDTPLHLGLEDATDFPHLSPDGLGPGESRLLTVVVQDQTGVVRTMRLVTIPTLILAHLAPLLERQLAERWNRKCRRRHFQALRDYYARTGSPEGAFAGAPIKAQVA